MIVTMAFYRVRPYGAMAGYLLMGACLFMASAIHARGLDEVTAEGRPLLESFAPSALSILTTARQEVRFEVFLALDETQRTRGLMFVDALPDNAGMLFMYDSEQLLSMWMKNTRLPLDMLFIDGNGTIVYIVRGTVPYSLGTISSKQAAIAVLEIKSGQTKRYGIRPGDRVVHELFRKH